MADNQDNYNEDYYNDEEHLRNKNNEEHDIQDNQDIHDIQDINDIDENYIPVNSTINNYNEHFYELYCKIKLLRCELTNINESLKDYIIQPIKINLDEDLEISVKCLKSLIYLIKKKNISNQHIVRLMMCDIFYSDIFIWDSIYDDTWNEELQILGI
jgi:hypothetical protein